MDYDQKLLTIPIDQFGRYSIVAQKIKTLMKIKNQKKVSILDIGGYKGEIHQFFEKSEATITILDLPDNDEKNYIKGSALDLPFKDDSFDYVVSFEVFEHIPRDDRKKYIDEAIRVSKGIFILTAPFAGINNEVGKSEEYVNSLWKNMHAEDNRWLQEHISNKIPTEKELEDILKDRKMIYRKMGNNDLMLWNLMLSFNYITTLYRGNGLNPDVQLFYNQNTDVFESNADSYYRYIYIIGDDASLLKDENCVKSSRIEKRDMVNQLINKIFIAISTDIKENFDKKQIELDKVAKELEVRIAMYDSLYKEYESIYKILNKYKNTIAFKITKRMKIILKKLLMK